MWQAGGPPRPLGCRHRPPVRLSPCPRLRRGLQPAGGAAAGPVPRPHAVRPHPALPTPSAEAPSLCHPERPKGVEGSRREAVQSKTCPERSRTGISPLAVCRARRKPLWSAVTRHRFHCHLDSAVGIFTRLWQACPPRARRGPSKRLQSPFRTPKLSPCYVLSSPSMGEGRVRVKPVSPKRNPTRRSGKAIIALTVKEILEEEIAKKLA